MLSTAPRRHACGTSSPSPSQTRISSETCSSPTGTYRLGWYGRSLPTTAGKIVAQPETAKIALYITLVAIPVVCDVVAVALLWFYRLDERQMTETPRGR